MTLRRSALVIGNAQYDSAGLLQNPTNDARDIAQRLAECGFDVVIKTDCTTEQMERALDEFKTKLSGSEVGLFFFAGHGFQVDGYNYLAGTDANVGDEIAAKYSTLPLNQVIEVMERAEVDSSVIILDACRDNPFENRWSRSAATRGLATVYAPKGSLIAFATSPGQIALDGQGGSNGRYTESLLRHIGTPDVAIETMFKRVRNSLSAATQGKQISWEHTSLSGELFFSLSVGARIDIYANTALSDSLFVLDESKYSHRLIKVLKSYNWYAQNDALQKFTASRVARSHINNLFVVGRNVYQAACGGSHEAHGYIEGFLNRTADLDNEKRKAILDGMLFEVFFDGKGKLREQPKSSCFGPLFALQQHDELSDSFAFVAECLLPYASRFYAIPGKTHAMAVDVIVSRHSAQSLRVDQICVAGRNVLVAEDEDSLDSDGTPASYRRISQEELRERLTQELLIPDHLLALNFNEAPSESERLRYPAGYTTVKC